MKFATDRPYGDPEKAARKLVEIANSVEAAQDGRIFIKLVDGGVSCTSKRARVLGRIRGGLIRRSEQN